MKTQKPTNDRKQNLNWILISLMLSGFLGRVTTSLAAEDTWTYKAEMPTARGFTSGCVLNGKIYVIGGFPTHFSVTSAVEMYDPTTDSWTRMANMPAGRCGHATRAFDGKIYVFGGVSPDPYSTARRNVYVYDPPTDTWTRKADMPYANALCGIAVVDGTIYLVGGALSASSPTVSTLMAYDPIAESWTRKADMPTSRAWLSACAVDGRIYAIGGAPQNYQAGCYKNVEVYDPSTDTWTRKSNMSTARAAVSTCAAGGRIYATGGFSPTGVFTTNEMYDPATDTWITKSPLQQKRLMSFMGTVADKMYVAGGSYPDSQGQPVILSTLEEYDAGLGGLPPDFNGDGAVNIKDLLRVVGSWEQDDPVADIAPPPFGDGAVNALDLELLMSYWEQAFDDPTLVAHWDLDEAAGGVALDSAGGNDGYVFGDPVWEPDGGQVGGAMSFDGIDDHIVAGPALNPADGPFSVFAWVNGGMPGQVVISQFNGDNWLGNDPASGCLATELCGSGRGGVPLLSAANITDGSWHRIGFVWDGEYRVIYVDDIAVAEDTQTGLESCAGGLKIGGGIDPLPGTLWSGLIDDVRIYNRAVRP